MNSIKQKGITLIELMIALILALIVSATILTIFISNVKSSAENIQMIQLNQELRAAMNFMSDEVKRHGYSSASSSTAMNTLRTSGCIVYSYTASGAVATVRGFRLDNGDLEWCSDGASTASCGTCSATWQPITTSGITTITDFTFDPSNTASDASMTIHRLDVTLTGQRQLNPGIASRTIEETIRIRNEDPS